MAAVVVAMAHQKTQGMVLHRTQDMALHRTQVMVHQNLDMMLPQVEEAVKLLHLATTPPLLLPLQQITVQPMLLPPQQITVQLMPLQPHQTTVVQLPLHQTTAQVAALLLQPHQITAQPPQYHNSQPPSPIHLSKQVVSNQLRAHQLQAIMEPPLLQATAMVQQLLV